MIARSDAACFVGVDLHKDTLTACVINAATQEVSYAKIACKSRSRIREFFSTLRHVDLEVAREGHTIGRRDGARGLVVAVEHDRAARR